MQTAAACDAPPALIRHRHSVCPCRRLFCVRSPGGCAVWVSGLCAGPESIRAAIRIKRDGLINPTGSRPVPLRSAGRGRGRRLAGACRSLPGRRLLLVPSQPAEYRQRREVRPAQGDGPDSDVDADPALLGPVDVLPIASGRTPRLRHSFLLTVTFYPCDRTARLGASPPGRAGQHQGLNPRRAAFGQEAVSDRVELAGRRANVVVDQDAAPRGPGRIRDGQS